MNNDPWGGSEFLWSEAAIRLKRAGHTVGASVNGWPQKVPQHTVLLEAGVEVIERALTADQFASRSAKRLLLQMFDTFLRQISRRRFVRRLAQARPDLICISNGGYADNMSLLEICMRAGIPYVIIAHANSEHMWPDDKEARTIRDLYGNARRAFFVSNNNRRLLETQLGMELTNAEIVRNPFNVRRDAAPAWPSGNEAFSLACIGRLDPSAKGQDLLLQVLAREVWRSRPVRVSFFGKGRCAEGLRRLAERLRLQDHVRFCGHVDNVEEIWATHHALVLPSRYEGLPLAIVEAMHCGRPVIVTDVAGNAELIEDGVTGFVTEAATENHLHAALERAWELRHNWQSMGQAARRAIRENIPPDPVGDFTQKLLGAAGEKHFMSESRQKETRPVLDARSYS